MNVTREIVEDLLPLYVAGSTTRSVVKLSSIALVPTSKTGAFAVSSKNGSCTAIALRAMTSGSLGMVVLLALTGNPMGSVMRLAHELAAP